MSLEGLDDELPEPLKQPDPGGWFEVFCCLAILGAFVVGLVILGLVH
jgi:hypothetical protein